MLRNCQTFDGTPCKAGAADRLESLDVLRGFDMLFIMGFSEFLVQLLSSMGLEFPWLTEQFHHAVWHGLRFEDTIFPLFLFLSGVSWPFSLAKRRRRGDSTGKILGKIMTRALLLVLMGFVYNGILKLDFANMVWGAVLVRIGLAWAVAAVLSVFFGVRSRVWMACVILLGHWMVCVLLQAPDTPFGSDPLSAEGCFAGWLDRRLLPGRLTNEGVISSQGVFSTFPAVVTAMFGTFAGELLRRADVSGKTKTLQLFSAGGALVAVGVLVASAFGRYSMPFNKILWSSSFTLVVGGYSAILLAVFYWTIDVRRCWHRTLFFRVIGMNSLTIYMARRIVPFGAIATFFVGGLAGLLPEVLGRAVVLGAVVAIEWIFLWFLYRKKVFLRV